MIDLTKINLLTPVDLYIFYFLYYYYYFTIICSNFDEKNLIFNNLWQFFKCTNSLRATICKLLKDLQVLI